MIDKLYQDTLAYLYSLLPMYQKDGSKAFKKGLDNITNLCWGIGLPQWRFNTLHVAGTNGKGSVSSMLTSVLMEAGYKVGTYTSPHLVEFTERIRINGQEISQRAVVEFVECYAQIIEKIQPSFFELTVAMAFDYFAEEQVDIAVIEVGLGGRLDSTNIIRPELSVITNISYDHMDMLGDTLEEIAEEKAGIIKPFTPVIIGDKHPETQDVFRKTAADLGAPLIFAEDAFKIHSQHTAFNEQVFEVYHAKEEVHETIYLDLRGNYQGQNLRTALATIEALREDIWEISDDQIIKGLRKVQTNSGIRGRMEQLSKEPLVMCDTGHNLAGVKSVVEQLVLIPHSKLHMVWGMVSDKDHHSILALLPLDATYYFVKPNVPRGLDASLLKVKAEGHGIQGQAYPSVSAGLEEALKAAEPNDLIFIGGSTFVVADVLRHQKELAEN